MKKFIASILSTLILSSFVSNVSFCSGAYASNNANQTQTEKINNVINETTKEKTIKLLKQEYGEKCKFFENEIEKLENISDEDYEKTYTKSFISRFKFRIISFGVLTILSIMSIITSILNYHTGYNSGKTDAYVASLIKSCEDSKVDTSEEKKFLKSLLSNLHPDKFNFCKSSNCLQQIFKQAKLLLNK